MQVVSSDSTVSASLRYLDIVLQDYIGTVFRAALWKLQRDGAEIKI